MKLVLGDGAYYEDRAVLREEMLADDIYREPLEQERSPTGSDVEWPYEPHIIPSRWRSDAA